MLIAKNLPLAANDTIVLRLVTGEEIVGRLVSQNTDGLNRSVTLTKPIVLAVNMLPNGQAGIQFMPFMVGAEEADNFTIDLSKIITQPMRARKDVATNYLQATSSIVPAAAGSLKL